MGHQALMDCAQPQASTAPARHLLQRKCACGHHASAGAECSACADRRGANASGHVPEGLRLVQTILDSPGQPMEPVARTLMESQFGYDFSSVRVHSDPAAARSAQLLNASAYTVGNHVVFGLGQYAPASSPGRELIAHELTHVIQQSRSSGNAADGQGVTIVSPDDASESQADANASGLNAVRSLSGRAQLQSARSDHPLIQRQPTGRQRTQPGVRVRPPVVEDGQRAEMGQMRRTEFLAELERRVTQESDAELAPAGRTARGCPYILRTIERYRGRPLASLMRLVQHFAHPPAGTDASGIVEAVALRARRAARAIARGSDSRLQASSENSAASLPAHDPVQLQSQLGTGFSLHAPVREQMEQTFGTSFQGVRIHTDGTATRLSSHLHARAFTIGDDIAFAPGQYQPGTLHGDALIAHELAHTLQQRDGRPSSASDRGADRELERQADRAAIAAIAGRHGFDPASRATARGVRVQRTGVEEAVLIAALVTAEVGTEVVVAEGTVVVVEAATPVLVETLAAETAPIALEATAPALFETAAVETVAPTVAQTVSASSAYSTAAAVVGTGVVATTLTGDTPTEETQGPCPVVPRCPHRGPNTNNHHTCADLAPPNVFPGCDAFVAQGAKAFDALDPLGNLWEIKTGDPSLYPDFLQTASGVEAGLLEIQREDQIARACNRNFILGVTTPGALAWYQIRLPNIVSQVISC